MVTGGSDVCGREMEERRKYEKLLVLLDELSRKKVGGRCGQKLTGIKRYDYSRDQDEARDRKEISRKVIGIWREV